MIQRLQTLYWIVAIALLGFYVAYLTNFNVNSLDPDYVLSTIFAVIALLLDVLAIFTFKKRMLQIIFSTISILMIFTQIGVSLIINWNGVEHIQFPQYLMLLGAVILNIIAINYVRKDQKLVTTSNRLR